MPQLREVALGLVTAAISFALGYAWRRIRQAYRTRSARRFWRPLIEGPTLVVLSRFRDFSDFEPSGLIGAGDSRALQELTSYFSKIGLEVPEVVYDGSVTGDRLQRNLILLGGPDANELTKLVLAKCKAKLTVIPESAEIQDGEATLRPCLQDGDVVFDCGAVLRLTSPFWSRNKVVIVAGGFGYGTWAAVQLTREPEFLKRSATLDDFECSFGVDVVLATPQQARIRSLRSVTAVRLARDVDVDLDEAR